MGIFWYPSSPRRGHERGYARRAPLSNVLATSPALELKLKSLTYRRLDIGLVADVLQILTNIPRNFPHHHRSAPLHRATTAAPTPSLQLQFPEDDQPVEVFRRWHDDLPTHILGAAYWSHSYRDGRRLNARPGYRVHINGNAHYVEFINHAWYHLEKQDDDFVTRRSHQIARENSIGLGWWNSDDEENPERLPPTTAPEPVTGDGPHEDQLERIEETITVVDPIEELTTAFAQLTPIHIDAALIEEDIEPTINLAPDPITPTIFATYIVPAIPAVPVAPIAAPAMAAAPLTGAFKGAIPTTFAGNRAESKQFLREFRQFRRNNRDHASILSPYL
ncbi:hypothetical protein EDB83DRAFT_2641797 [Lactarius deliciosus]|nr:hypothetical protein EDB83DRAFT_2641797 [Lactarius deliciosus]